MPEQINLAVNNHQNLISEYYSFLNAKEFPCIAAKAAQAKQQVKCMVAGNMACPKDDADVYNFLCDFVNAYKSSKEFYHSAAIIFTGPQTMNEEMFDMFLWQRLQALEIIDAANCTYDKRVEADINSSNFSFSINEEAFYIIGLHAASSRQARKFKYPTLVFNPHAQFEHLKASLKYDAMKNVVRKRDILLSGSINPMLKDFGEASEVYQYSGRQYNESWKCPLKITHGIPANNSTT